MSEHGKRMVKIAVIICLVFVAAVPAGIHTYSRYVQQKKLAGATAVPQEFYFTGDVLKEEGGTYTIYDWTAGIPVTVNNFADSMRFSKTEIQYTVICEKGACSIDGGSKLHEASGTLKGGAAHTGNITIWPDQGEKSVTVTATSEAPYKKTLKAKFLLQDSSDLLYAIEDSSGEATAELTIKGGRTEQTLTIAWNESRFSPDNTNIILRGEPVTGGSVKIAVEPMGSCSLLFFKTDPSSDYSVSERAPDGTTITLP